MDDFQIEILADGTIKSTSGKFGSTNHASAEAFLSMVARLTGGTTDRRAHGAHATHTHSHHGGHEHTHEGG